VKSVDNSKELVCIGAGGKVAYGESSHFGLTLVLGVSFGIGAKEYPLFLSFMFWYYGGGDSWRFVG